VVVAPAEPRARPAAWPVARERRWLPVDALLWVVFVCLRLGRCPVTGRVTRTEIAHAIVSVVKIPRLTRVDQPADLLAVDLFRIEAVDASRTANAAEGDSRRRGAEAARWSSDLSPNCPSASASWRASKVKRLFAGLCWKAL
jgi:hypothetical protein